MNTFLEKIVTNYMSVNKHKKKKYDLLYLSLDFPPNIGGISRLAGGLTRALLSKGFKICVVTHNNKIQKHLKRPNTDYFEVTKIKFFRDLQIIHLVRRHGLKYPILSSLWNPEATLAMLAGAKRVSILVHGTELINYKFKPFRTWLRRIVLEKAHIVICNSNHNQKIVKKIAPKASTKVIYPAIDTKKFKVNYSKKELRKILNLPLEKKIILTVSRLIESKGHATVLNAISSLNLKYRNNLLYVVIGEGSMIDRLIKLSYDLKINKQVKFIGYVDNDLPLWYRACDLSVLTSIGIEGFGISLIEAQASSIPVIGTRCGGIPEAIIEGNGGWLINEKDSKALANYISLLFDNNKLFKTQGRNGLKRMKRDLNWDNYVQQLAAHI